MNISNTFYDQKERANRLKAEYRQLITGYSLVFYHISCCNIDTDICNPYIQIYNLFYKKSMGYDF